jgi:gliding motility-associated-like protein
MIKKKSYILLLTLLFTVPLFAQRETANWYFGSNVGLDFNNGNPVLQTDGQLTTTEGCSTVSDNNGSLLFYTNGVNIWNKNHNIMQNGSDLLGSDSGSQSAIVIPNVSNSNIYYVFTADVYQAYTNGNNGNGINYSVVDMSLNGGLGTVISKNVNLLPQGSEKLSAVSSLDGTGFWVVTHKGNKFYGFKVDGSGVNAPVISTIGINITGVSNIRGNIKFSPNGKRLAITHSIFEPTFNGYLNIYDFNLNTGVVNNEKQIATDRVFYGVEFSPDSSKLFASGMLVVGSGSSSSTADIELYQYDLSFSDIGRTEFLINAYYSPPENHLAGALQLAFNKKVYHSKLYNYLSVINDKWRIKRPEYFQEATISVFDRYGKLLKVMTANDGWDGTHEGAMLTPSDYWFSIALNEKVVFGHFTLKL